MSSQDLPARVRLTLASQNRSTVSIVITASDSDNTFAIGREDYTEETMAVANAQAVGVAEDAKNRYSLSIGSSMRSLQNNGKPSSIEDGGPGGDNVFADEFRGEKSSAALAVFENSSNSRLHNFNVIKGNAAPATDADFDYMTQVLSDVNENGPDSKLAKSVDKIANENNRFSSTSKYLTAGQKENETRIGSIVVQPEFGVHAPRTYPDSKNTSEIELSSLKNLGLQLLLKSSGELFVPSNLNTEDFGEVLAAKGLALVPGLARLGLKIPVGSMGAGRIMSEVQPDFSKPVNSVLSGDELLSHGSYNSPLVPFDSVDSRTSVAAAIVLVATITGIFEALSRAFDPRNGLQSPLAGSLFNTVNSAVMDTRNDYTVSVREGLRLFFGGGTGPGDIGGMVFDGLSKFNDSPGYYNTILRSLTKMIAYEIGQVAFSALSQIPGMPQGNTGPFTTNSGLEIQQPGLSNDVASNLLNAVRKMSQSRIVGFMNVMATMGDISISMRELGVDQGSLANLSVTHIELISDRIETSDQMSTISRPNLAALPARNKLSTGGLAFQTRSTPSAFILPDSIDLAERDLGGSDGAIGAKLSGLGMKTNAAQQLEGNRISPTVVASLEKELDASYVPFYFHDLRTNEIVSFHAFLEDMSDTFNAEYGESTGYGRIGKVYTYKNTDRTISLGFSVVATSDEDFDTMWWKINKLITLVYPQYTTGRVIDFEGEKFVQPFSQLPSASPLIRLRLGDVLRSNYSKFNLARLFGLGQGTQTFSLNQETVQQTREQTRNRQQRILAARQRMLRGVFKQNERFYVSYIQHGRAGVRGRSSARLLVGTEAPAHSFVLQQLPTQQQTTPAPTASPAGSARRGAGATASARRAAEPAPLATNSYLMRVMSTQEYPDGTVVYTVKIDNSSDSTQYQIRIPTNGTPPGTESPTNVSAYRPFEPDILAEGNSGEAPASSTDSNGNTAELVREFFKHEGEGANPIFKAFESTKGKGLAGFIKSIKLDWNESPWQVEKLNGRAPMMCKINIDFAPIHDINPGLDSSGFSTAPVYNIGSPSTATSTTVDSDGVNQAGDESSFAEAQDAMRLPQIQRGRGAGGRNV